MWRAPPISDNSPPRKRPHCRESGVPLELVRYDHDCMAPLNRFSIFVAKTGRRAHLNKVRLNCQKPSKSSATRWEILAREIPLGGGLQACLHDLSRYNLFLGR
jgi:hypothetical protein